MHVGKLKWGVTSLTSVDMLLGAIRTLMHVIYRGLRWVRDVCKYRESEQALRYSFHTFSYLVHPIGKKATSRNLKERSTHKGCLDSLIPIRIYSCVPPTPFSGPMDPSEG